MQKRQQCNECMKQFMHSSRFCFSIYLFENSQSKTSSTGFVTKILLYIDVLSHKENPNIKRNIADAIEKCIWLPQKRKNSNNSQDGQTKEPEARTQ